MPEVIGEYIDRLCSVEMRTQGDLPRGVTHRLYDAARRAQGGLPLTYQAAQALAKRVQRGDRVLIVTGAGAPPGLPRGETDGPLGAASLARAADLALGARPIVATEERHVPPIAAAVEAAGISLLDQATAFARPHAGVLEAFPLGAEQGKTAAADLFDRYGPTAVIFIEKAGPNGKGMFHSILGYGRGPDVMASAYWLVDEARRRGALSIGIGDGGNEIGFGKIQQAVREIQPYGARCQCPCGGGIATVVDCDILVAAAISNWGAYGVCAYLAYLSGDAEVLQDEDTERSMLETCVAAGGADGATGGQTLHVDGTPLGVQLALVRMLRTIVVNGMKVVRRSF